MRDLSHYSPSTCMPPTLTRGSRETIDDSVVSNGLQLSCGAPSTGLPAVALTGRVCPNMSVSAPLIGQRHIPTRQ